MQLSCLLLFVVDCSFLFVASVWVLRIQVRHPPRDLVRDGADEGLYMYTHVHVYLYIYIYIHTYMLYIYIYVTDIHHTYIYMYIYIYIYV